MSGWSCLIFSICLKQDLCRYEKQYETSVQHTGRERLVDTSIEALGTQERVVDTRHHVHANPMEQIARAVPVCPPWCSQFSLDVVQHSGQISKLSVMC